MAGLGDLFSSAGSAAEQLFIWSILNSIITALLAPVLNEVQQEALKTLPNAPLDPSIAASLAAQQLMSQGDAETEAAKSGIAASKLDLLIKAAGGTLDLGAVVSAYQRQLISDGTYDPTDISLQGAMASASIRPGWLPILKQLTVAIPSVAEVMNAWLEGQNTADEAQTRYLAAGGDPTWLQTSYDTNGQAPTPVEALDMLNRGIIPEDGTGPTVVSYQQAFLEGPWRNKWLSAFEQLRNYLPPPRTVTAMYHDGQLTAAQASGYLTQQGLTPDLVTAYLTPVTKTSTVAAKTLAESQVISLYDDQIITSKQAHDYLVALKYPPDQADLLLELADFKTTASALSASVTQVRALFQAGKLNHTQALAELEALDVSGDTAKGLLDTWAITVSQPTKTLSAAEVANAYHYALLDAPTALADLEGMGYDDRDAYLVLAVRNHGAIPGVPLPAGVLPPAAPPVKARGE